jgi:hypothetical protein
MKKTRSKKSRDTVPLKEEIIHMLTLLPKGVQKIIKTFLIEDFFHLPLAAKTLVVHSELRISPRIFEKSKLP